jgi:two-component system response regulator MprA
MPVDMGEEHWSSVDEAAAHLGVRRDSIYRWIEQRGLPATKIGKLWKLKLSEVDRWVRAQEGGTKRGARKSVLIIDDDELVRDTLHDFLSDEGFDTLVAEDGAQGLEVLASAKSLPSIIVLDLKMPRVDGWAFQEELARQPALASIPLIIVTAMPRADVRGALVLRKPLRLPQLRAAIEQLLAGAAVEARS